MPSKQAITPVHGLPTPSALAGQWVLDPSRSTVSLLNRSMWGLATVRGSFRDVTGSGTVSPAGQVSGVLTVAAASIDTKVARRDKHLRSADFFDSGKYPDITFTVEAIQPSDAGIVVTGMLNVRDRARPLTFDAAADVREAEVAMDATIKIDHTDFGITWNLLGTVSAVNTVTIHAVFTRQ